MRCLIFLLIVSANLLFFSKPVFSKASTPNITPTIVPLPTPTPLVVASLPISGISLTISPIFFNLTTDPGVPISSQLKIFNHNNFKEYLTIKIAKFTSNEAGDKPVLQEITPQDEFAKWISFSEDKFVVDINEEKVIKYTINTPRDASFGYYYALVVQRIKENNIQSAGAVTSGSPASLLLLEVRNPNAKKDLQLLNFTTDSPFYEYLPVKFNVQLKNTGNIHLVPHGNIFIDWGNQKDIGILLANGASGNILPSTIRTYQVNWDDGFVVNVPKEDHGIVVKDGSGKIVYEPKLDLSKLTHFRIGKYTAHLLAVYDNGQRDVPLEATVSFWIIPWKIILGVVLIVGFVFLGVRSVVGSLFKKVKKLGGR